MSRSIHHTFVAIALVMLCTSIAHAFIAVEWKASGGIDDITVAADGPDITGGIAQLIWSIDPTIPPINPIDPLVPFDEDDFVLKTTMLPPGGAFDDGISMFGDESDPFVGGFIYTRVFNSESPSALPGDIYGDGPIIGPIEAAGDPADTALAVTLYDLAPGGPFVADLTIPEPSTAAAFITACAYALTRRYQTRRCAE